MSSQEALIWYVNHAPEWWCSMVVFSFGSLITMAVCIVLAVLYGNLIHPVLTFLLRPQVLGIVFTAFVCVGVSLAGGRVTLRKDWWK